MSVRSSYKKTVYPNKLTLITERVSGLNGLALGVWIKAGTRQESPQALGISHYLEHMLFKGTKSRTALQIAREIDQVGGEFNAFTAREYTCFHITLLNKNYELGLDILCDIILNSSFKKDEFDLEKKVILQEISMVDESPEELVHDLFFETVLRNHSLGRPILGTQQSIQKMRRTQLVDFFVQHYRPEKMVVSVVGDISHEMVSRKIKPLTGKTWPGRAKASSDAGGQQKNKMPRAIPNLESGVWVVRRPTEQVHLVWGSVGPHYTSNERYAAAILNVFLGAGMSSTLFQEIREKRGLAYTIYSGLSPFTDTGMFTVYSATHAKNVVTCLKLIEKCISRVKKKELSKRELRNVQNNIKGTFLLSADNVESRMSRLAINEIFLGRYLSGEEFCKGIDRTSADQILTLANKIFRDYRRHILVMGSKLPQKLVRQVRALAP